MSVSEADMMTLLGETQQVFAGDNQQTAEYSAAVQRQYEYQQGQSAEFGTSFGPQALDTAVQLVTGGAIAAATSFQFGGGGGIGSALQNTPGTWTLSQQEGAAGAAIEPIFVPNMPPPDLELDREPRGNPRGSSPNLPEPYQPPPTGSVPFFETIPGAVTIGAILGGVIGAIVESDFPGIGMIPGFRGLDPELGPYDTRAPSASPEVILSGPGAEDMTAGPIQPQGPDLNRLPIPGAEPTPYDFGDVYDRARKAMEDQLIKDMTTPQPLPPPAPAPAQQGFDLPPWAWGLIGVGGIALLRRSRRSSSGFIDPLTAGAILPGSEAFGDPITAGNQLPGLSPLTAASGGVYDYAGDDGCNCGPKRSGKKRRCLAKAQIGWRSGPKKGKLAGKRCYRYAND